MNQPTKGPWKYNPERGDITSTTVTKEESRTARGLAESGDDVWNYYGGELVAETVCACDGPVLAAAWEVLEALRKIAANSTCTCVGMSAANIECIQCEARIAIAKAEPR